MVRRVEIRPWDDELALKVFRNLDPNDRVEADIQRGAPATPLEMWHEWKIGRGVAYGSFVAVVPAKAGGAMAECPFAVFTLSQAGQAGIGWAALLACNHDHFRLELAQVAAQIRHGLPLLAAESNLVRIETRCWADHPTAQHLLRALGFAQECEIDVSDAIGPSRFLQFARRVDLPSIPSPDQMEPQPCVD